MNDRWMMDEWWMNDGCHDYLSGRGGVSNGECLASMCLAFEMIPSRFSCVWCNFLNPHVQSHFLVWLSMLSISISDKLQLRCTEREGEMFWSNVFNYAALAPLGIYRSKPPIPPIAPIPPHHDQSHDMMMMITITIIITTTTRTTRNRSIHHRILNTPLTGPHSLIPTHAHPLHPHSRLAIFIHPTTVDENQRPPHAMPHPMSHIHTYPQQTSSFPNMVKQLR